MVDSMTDIDLATVHPLAPADPPGTEVPGAIFRYWNTEDGPRYGAQRCRRSTPGTPGSSAPARTLTPGTSDRPRPGRPRCGSSPSSSSPASAASSNETDEGKLSGHGDSSVRGTLALNDQGRAVCADHELS